jgi:NAD(P)H dehydrogenase (quinone)
MTQTKEDAGIKKPCHTVILCHPSTDSFNAAVARTYCKTVRACGQQAILRDLYRLGFDPVLRDSDRPDRAEGSVPADVAAEVRALRSADVVVLIYPVWFGSPPAMLKGYVERVFGSNFGYQLVRSGAPHPQLAGKPLVSITTSGMPIQWFELKGARAALKTLFDDYLVHAFGMSSAEHLHISGIVDGLSPQILKDQLARVADQARAVCDELTARPLSTGAR